MKPGFCLLLLHIANLGEMGLTLNQAVKWANKRNGMKYKESIDMLIIVEHDDHYDYHDHGEEEE